MYSNNYNDLSVVYDINDHLPFSITPLLNLHLTLVYSSQRNCGRKTCVDVPCSDLAVIRGTKENPHDKVQCKIGDWVFPKLVYNITVTGANEFASHAASFLVSLNSPIGK